MSTPQSLKSALLVLMLAALGCASPLPEERPVDAGPIDMAPDEWRVADNIIVITDASGTMYVNETFPAAKALTRSFVAAMPSKGAPAAHPGGYRAAAIGFGGDDRVATGLRDFDRTALASNAANLQIMGDVNKMGGTTPLHKVIVEVARELGTHPGRTAIVIFSDGLPDQPDVTIDNAKQLVAGRRSAVCIHTVHTGSDPAGRAFLDELSDASPCGSDRAAADLGSAYHVQQFVKAVLVGRAELPSVAAAGPCHGVMRLHGIQFDFDRDAIRQKSQPLLDIAVERMNECPQVRIIIGGHTDSIGSDGYNVDLSYRRAVATRDYFVKSGIDGARLGTEGFGEANPIAPNRTDEERALNRRVELSPMP